MSIWEKTIIAEHTVAEAAKLHLVPKSGAATCSACFDCLEPVWVSSEKFAELRSSNRIKLQCKDCAAREAHGGVTKLPADEGGQ